MATAKKADETKKVTKATPAAALAKVEAAKKEEELTGSILPEGTEEELMAGEAEEE